MLTIAYVLLALQMLVVATPVDRVSQGTRISLAKRQNVTVDGVVDIEYLGTVLPLYYG